MCIRIVGWVEPQASPTNIVLGLDLTFENQPEAKLMSLFDPPPILDSSGRMAPPAREQIETIFLDLIDGRRSRDDVSRWAGQWVFGNPSDDTEPAVWDALVVLTMVDLITTDRPFLYVEEDFRYWLEDFRKKCDK